MKRRCGSCALLHEKRAGTFRCAACDQPLFVSKVKFESGTGCPSFNDPLPGAIETGTDRHGMVRDEVHCSRCGVTSDMCSTTDRRRPICATTLNGVALKFEPA